MNMILSETRELKGGLVSFGFLLQILCKTWLETEVGRTNMHKLTDGS
jgi:hypothetical protein